MPRGNSARRKQRRYALRILFEMDMNRSSVDQVLEGKKLIGEEAPVEFTLELARGVQDNQPEIDRLISGYSKGWELQRMPRVDRSILRMALYELLYMEDIPPGVTIDEAVELAKAFSTGDSGKFINGVLGNVNRDREEGKLNLSR